MSTLWPADVDDPLSSAWDAAESAEGEDRRWRVEKEWGEASLTNGSARIAWFQPLEHQAEAYLSPARFKLLRWGRRRGKTRLLWLCALEGHGPLVQRGDEWEPLHRGILHGFDVAWLARDQKQARALWDEEIEPFFRNVDGVSINATERFVRLHGTPGKRGFGTLYLRSNENVASVRGIGKHLIGVGTDEAAYFYLRHALDRVVGPALVDNFGWFVGCSTTNGGSDGDPEHPEGPSWFNQLCERIQQSNAARAAGSPGDADLPDDWAEFHGTTRDNKILPAEAVEAEYARLAHDQNAIAEELDAKLGVRPSGLAFPEWREDLLVTDVAYEAPGDWVVECGGDWGYGSPGWFGINQFGPDRVHLARELLFNGFGKGGWKEPNRTPYEVGKRLGELILNTPVVHPRRIVFDIPDDLKDGRGGVRHESIKDELVRGMKEVLEKAERRMPIFQRQDKDGQSRAARKLRMHEVIRFEPDAEGKVPAWAMPQLSVHPSCEAFLRSVPRLPLDPLDHNDVDTNAFDHPYDGETGLLISRPRKAKPPAAEKPKPDRNVDTGLEKVLARHADAQRGRYGPVKGLVRKSRPAVTPVAAEEPAPVPPASAPTAQDFSAGIAALLAQVKP